MPDPELALAPSFATLVAHDLPATTRWYREALGFAIVVERPGLNGRPVLAHLRRGPGQDLMLAAAAQPEIGEPGQGVTLTFVVDEDIHALATRAAAAGAEVADAPRAGLRSLREIELVDPNGYRLVFAQRP